MQNVRRMRFGAWGALLFAAPLLPAVLWFTSERRDVDAPPTRLEVSLSSRVLRVYQGGEVVRTYGVAVGRPSHPTPKGNFRTGGIDWNPSWTPPPTNWARGKKYQPPGAASNPMQGVKIYFLAPYYFIHGTNNPGSIGEAASHGCIRMTADDAVALAHWIQSAGGSVSLSITS